jgi:recombination protein RecA
VRRAEQIKEDGVVIGNRTKIKVVKNKVAPPFRLAEVDIMYGHGFSQTGEIVDMAVDKEIMQKSGSWYSYGEDRIGQGREKTKNYLDEHPDMKDEIRLKVRSAYDMDGMGESVEEETEELAGGTKDKKKTADPETLV